MTWFEDDEFVDHRAVPGAVHRAAGPHGPALVTVHSNGSTTSGWGLAPRDRNPGFMVAYERNAFWAKPRLQAYHDKGTPFAIVMRSVNLVALDLDRHGDDDGPDGFVEIMKKIPSLPPTLAETSKSGKGRHLFYSVPHDIWDPGKGFGRYEDAIGLFPGVDLRAVGCVYHYNTQRWNSRPIAPLPKELEEILEIRRNRKINYHAALAAAAAAPDDEDAIIMHDALLQELNGPVKPGTRNITMFAIGSKMAEAGYPGWEKEVERRCDEIGLDDPETAKIIRNIQKSLP